MKKFIRILLLNTLILFFSACKNQEEQEIRTLPKPVTIIKLRDNNGANTYRQLSGVLQSSDATELSFDVAGRVASVMVDLGTNFKKGDILAELDADNYKLILDQRYAELSEAQARFTEAESSFYRNKELLKENTISKVAYEIAKANYDITKVKVDIAKTRIKLAQEDIDGAKITAPYDGVVSIRDIEPYQYVNSGRRALLVQGLSILEVAVLVPETIISHLKKGDKATLTIPAYPSIDQLQATITEIGNNAENANSFPVTLTLDKQITELKAGMSADVRFVFSKFNTESQDIFNIPVTAISPDEGQGYYVYRISQEEQKLERIPIELIEIFQKNALIHAPLESDDIIVRAGVAFLYDGQLVRPIELDVRIYNE